MSKAEPAEQDPVTPFEHKLAIQAWWGYNARAQQAGVKASLRDFLAGWEARRASAPNTDVQSFTAEEVSTLVDHLTEQPSSAVPRPVGEGRA